MNSVSYKQEIGGGGSNAEKGFVPGRPSQSHALFQDEGIDIHRGKTM